MSKYFSFSGKIEVVVELTDDELATAQYPEDVALDRAYQAVRSGTYFKADADMDCWGECDEYGAPIGGEYKRI